jgi:hypothetical protein
MSLETIGNIEVASDQACVVYDTKTGRIQHVHRVITLRGGDEPKRSEIETRAIDAARKSSSKLQLKTLVVPSEQLHSGATHKVDPKKRLLVSKAIKLKTK